MSFATETKRDAESGGGLIGKVLVEYGFKVYATGLTPREAFFAFDYRDRAARAKALAAARKCAMEHSATRRPSQPSVQFVVYKPTVKGGKGETWKGDRYFATEVWTDDYLQIVQPELERLGIEPGEYWGRISFKPNVRGKLKRNPQPGHEQDVELVAYLSEVFPDEAAAEAAAGELGKGNGPTESEFDLGAWLPVRNEIVGVYQEAYGKAEGTPEQRIAAGFAAAAKASNLTSAQVEKIIHYSV